MRAAGIREYSAVVELLELPDPLRLGPDEVLLQVRCSGVGNWDGVVRTGDWDLGRRPPMALGVETAGVVVATGEAVTGIAAGDRLMTHSLPLRAQGAWAEWFVAAAGQVAKVADSVPPDVAGAMPIPGLTADQTLRDALGTEPGATLLVNGAAGVTGRLIVQLAKHLGAEVIAIAGAASAEGVLAAGAAHVLDRHLPDWPDAVLELTGGRGADRAANAVPGGTAQALHAVKDGGRIATITSDVPDRERGIQITPVVVAPDGPRLGRLAELLAAGAISVRVGQHFPLEEAERALSAVQAGTNGKAVVLQTDLHKNEEASLDTPAAW